MNLPSVMSHTFSEVPEAEIQRSSFERSHGYKTTFDAGYLVPVYVDEALPGDTFHLEMTAFARLATPLKPVMDNMHLETFFFAVPVRLIWENWQRFNGETDNPGDSTSYLVPQMSATNVATGSLSDYFGIPVGLANAISFNSLHHRAYNLIWNEWFRDQNLQNSAVVDKDDGPDTYGDYVLRRRGKRHDYFTSALPWPQKGAAVSIPLGTSATVKMSGTELITNSGLAATWRLSGGGAPSSGKSVGWGLPAGGATQLVDTTTVIAGPSGSGAYPSNLYADLSSATAATINSLRQAFQLQKLYERDARGGTRYTEILRAHFRVTSPDARLQRPEYLGGGYSPVNISPVVQTAPEPSTGTTTPQGNLAGFGTVTAMGHGFTKSFVEHCVLIGLVNVRADLTYQQGLNRMFSRRTRFDFYWPALAQIGEQTVLNKEICATGVPASDDAVFGYQERFAEYRYKPSQITGLFRSNTSAGATSIDLWHLSQDFASVPTLSSTFIEELPPVARVIAVPSEPHFLFDSFIRLHCARPMPVFGIPGMLDRF